MDRGFKEVVVLMILIVASLMVMVSASDEPSPSPSRGRRLKHFLCSVKCAWECHASLHHFPVLCMTKCVLKCLESSPPAPDSFLSSCTLDCAESTSSKAFPDEKELESYGALEQVGSFVGSCYDNCKEKEN
ncbi:hypothetical protein JCGZ_06247 [Jatropha curcas]|uniref:Uncharacterized protein n=1 Tax=Jatropha curcas TaxID=180498 RepID=A0A067KLR7_JATCU|nr:uncharacterized protein LOC105634955 [Jatropha curcas]KDP37191.1 hypothetical protein JCGZ_06247 [Jatropha curcas]